MCDSVQTTILFEDPFWIAMIERNINGEYSVARATIGTSEPTGVQTKAQAMLKQLHSEVQTERKQSGRIIREEDLKLKFEMRRQKRKKKHRGH
jgi:hypothetical protein